ncbi:hypothetical protein PanWU01x14_251500 [Parasponia andersonii]|uniref:Retrotransposon Copia-like N-terminal domain-containing protein n=1 Tax=Parasponia andersonii TaxID=3476 RepID=A0A2P5BCH8_PARAD|nr:hypothetical protein PanWU01x14_251500 [Parasponia andersonii]
MASDVTSSSFGLSSYQQTDPYSPFTTTPSFAPFLKLDCTNYLMWNLQVIDIIHDYDIIGYLLSTKHLSPEFLKSCDGENRLRAQILQLKMELQFLKKGNLSLTDYLAKLENLANQSTAATHYNEDEDLMMQALAGLDSLYDPIHRMDESFQASTTTRTKILATGGKNTKATIYLVTPETVMDPS